MVWSFSIVWLLSLSMMHVRFFLAVCIYQYFVLLYFWVVIHCMYLTQLIFPFTSWQTFGFFSFWKVNDKTTRKHLQACSCVGTLFNFFRSRIAELFVKCMFNFVKNSQNCLPKWLYHLTLYKQCRRVPVASQVHFHLFLLLLFLFWFI